MERPSEPDQVSAGAHAAAQAASNSAETASQRSLNSKPPEVQPRPAQAAPKQAAPVKKAVIASSASKDIESQPLSIQGEGTQKQAARKAAHSKAQSRSNTQVQQSSLGHNPSPPARESPQKIRQASRDSANEYDADEFEKEDLVQMGEPQKPIMRREKGRNVGQATHEKATNDSGTTRAGGSDSNSLMREISIRNKQDEVGGAGGLSSGPGPGPGPVPQLKQVNRGKVLNRNESKETLVVSARELNSPNKESLQSVASAQNLHSGSRG